MLSEKQINNFKRNGYIVIPNFLDQEEIGELSTSLEESKNTQQKKTNYNVLDDEKVWDFLCNKNLKKILSLIIGPEVYYLHDVSLLYGEIDSKYTWHRDNPCRRTGIGPDWTEKANYNVVSAAVYFSDSNESNSGLNLIPKSHFNEYKSTLSNLIRVLHNRTRNNKNFKFIRNICEKFIGHEIKYKPGDLIIFYCSLYHTGSLISKNVEKVYRDGIITRFGGQGVHSKNFMNYQLNYRKLINRILLSTKKEFFFDRLKKNNIFISPNVEQEKIEGIHIPKDQGSDGGLA